MKKKRLFWIKRHKMFLGLGLVLLSLIGTVTFFAQKQDYKQPDNPLTNDAVASSILLAGADKKVSETLKENGVSLKQNKETSDKEEEQDDKPKSNNDSKKNNLTQKDKDSLNKHISTKKIVDNTKDKKANRAYFTTTINDGEEVENNFYEFKIIQKEKDLVIEKQAIYINDDKVDFSGSVLLSPGKNTIKVVVTYQNKQSKIFDVSKSYTVYYNATYKIKATLKDKQEVDSADFSFEAYALQGDKKESVNVLLNEKEIEKKDDFNYHVSLKKGENLIDLSVGQDKNQVNQSYVIIYTPKKDIKDPNDENTENSEKPEPSTEGPEISVDNLVDGMETNNRNIDFNVNVTTADGKSIAYKSQQYEVLLNDQPIKPDTHDNYQSNFIGLRIEKGENRIDIIAEDKGKQTHNSYNIKFNDKEKEENLGDARFSISAANVGMSDIIPPVNVPLEKDKKAPEYILDLLEDYSFSPAYTGSIEQSFYLKGIYTSNGANFWHNEGPKIPDDLKEQLIEAGAFPEENIEDIKNDNYGDTYVVDGLGEMDFTGHSGWIYTVNGHYMEYGFSQYKVSSGDDIKIQYTLWRGRDIGGGLN
ncbi:MAG: DUF4430 domain-containing protein [Vagococcus sp.]|uniref:DUF4430 domain-containing protein n=1 Tax=Vagococcus sp. TaxID=1933889 RepID=UPI002FCC5955